MCEQLPKIPSGRICNEDLFKLRYAVELEERLLLYEKEV
jgi:hypothetical protein